MEVEVPTSLVGLPEPCLVAVLQDCLTTGGYTENLCSAACADDCNGSSEAENQAGAAEQEVSSV